MSGAFSTAFDGAAFDTGSGAFVGRYIALLTSLSEGHTDKAGYHPPAAGMSGSPNVRAGGVPVMRKTDPFVSHGHPLTISTGSGKVRVNGLPLARVGDLLSCGDRIATGSTKVRSA